MTGQHYYQDLDVDIKVNNGAIKTQAFVSNTKYNLLHSYLVNFWRWKAEGEKPWFRNNPNYSTEQPQYYYNTMDSEISYDPETDTYTFKIEDGSVSTGWWTGKFTLKGIKIELIETNIAEGNLSWESLS